MGLARRDILAMRALPIHGLCRSGCSHCRLRSKDELRITKLAHLRNIETRQLRLHGNSLSHEELEDEVDDEAEGKDKAHQRGDANQLRGKLAGIAVKQAGD